MNAEDLLNIAIAAIPSLLMTGVLLTLASLDGEPRRRWVDLRSSACRLNTSPRVRR